MGANIIGVMGRWQRRPAWMTAASTAVINSATELSQPDSASGPKGTTKFKSVCATTTGAVFSVAERTSSG